MEYKERKEFFTNEFNKEKKDIRNDILELIQVIKYYQRKDEVKIDEDEVKKCISRLEIKYSDKYFFR